MKLQLLKLLMKTPMLVRDSLLEGLVSVNFPLTEF
ncbi:hypothetical protein BDFB_014969 [Asbolus verrucosus]|uniref:Uncharacterized protein n=1 Tax=Asbolus verrucosus TaxID=1661398 RepID=A0A482VZN8_ASBVE|nr:hypothetical protein BDFB_014969 [Asbolus verrucosus]